MTANRQLPDPHATRAPITWPIWLLIACGWILLFAETLSVREANLDDVNFQRITTAGDMWDYIVTWGPIQGRFYGMAAFGPIWLLDSIANPWMFQLARLGLVVAALWLLGRLAVKVTGSAELNRLWWLLWIGCLQIPPTFYGLLSYPELQCGLIFVLLAAHAFWNHLEAGGASRRQPWMAGLLFLAGLQFHESFLAFSLLFTALSWWHERRQTRLAWIAPLAPIAAATAIYLGVYFAYRAAFATNSYYEGTRAGFAPEGALLYILRYGASSLPGFELLIDRDPTHPALAAAAEIGRRVGMFQLWRLPWPVVVGAASAWMLSRADRWTLSRRDTTLLALGFAAVGLLFLSMPAVSDKYQSFAYRRFYPHAYNFITISFLWLAVAVGSLGLASSAPVGSRSRCGIAGCLGLLFGLACLAAQITNPLALAEIKAMVSAAAN